MAESGELVHIRDMTPEDVNVLVALHQEAYQGAISASVGRGYLRALFRWLLNNQESIKLVAAKGLDVEGYIFGAADGYGTAMNRALLWPIVWGVLSHPWVVARPDLRAQLRPRLRSLLRRRKRKELGSDGGRPAEPIARTPRYVLIGIGVSPRKRRQGLATRLMDAFEHRVWDASYNVIRLTVRSWNVAAISLYEKRGWQRASQEAPNHALTYVLSKPSGFRA